MRIVIIILVLLYSIITGCNNKKAETQSPQADNPRWEETVKTLWDTTINGTSIAYKIKSLPPDTNKPWGRV